MNQSEYSIVIHPLCPEPHSEKHHFYKDNYDSNDNQLEKLEAAKAACLVCLSLMSLTGSFLVLLGPSGSIFTDLLTGHAKPYWALLSLT